MKHHITAIIPARGGSKGIPRKNVIPFCGKPLIAWTIEAGRQSRLINRVVVSTDDDEIAAVAEQYGAEVIRRPGDISTDISSSEDALLHALDQLPQQPDYTVFLQCTSPLTTGADIDQCIETLLKSGADTAFTATESHRFIWKTPMAAEGVNHSGAVRKRRQDLEKEFAENGAVYVMNTTAFMEHKHRFFGQTVISEMPAARSWEIDSPEDLTIAAALMLQPTPALPDRIDAIVFDFDGVMTDNAVYVSEDGKESVRCNRGDGRGIHLLRNKGLKMAVMSTEENPVVLSRCRKMKLECFHNLGETKLDTFTAWCETNQLDPQYVVYMGNDENDLGCLAASGFGVVPSDAHPSVRDSANLILEQPGGNGAVRELCDLILEQLRI